MKTTTKQRIEYLQSMGFDLTEFRKGARQIRIGCSQCAPIVITGAPCHEAGCPNEMKECNGCGNIVARRVKYCADCQ